MKKIYLLLICFFSINLAFAQKELESLYKDADPKFFKMGGKSIPSQKCFKLTDFKKKLEIAAKIDSLQYADFFIVRGRMAISQVEVNSLKEFNELDLYQWLISGEDVKEGTLPTSFKNADGTRKKFKARPSDRLSIELSYYQNGEKKSIVKNFTPFCEN